MAKSTSSLSTGSIASPVSTSSVSSASSDGLPFSPASSAPRLTGGKGGARRKAHCARKPSGNRQGQQGADRRKRLAANARERKRMHLLNEAYDELRRRLVDAENKSKYDVLVQAKEYIQALARICETFDKQQNDTSRATSLAPGQCAPAPPGSCYAAAAARKKDLSDWLVGLDSMFNSCCNWSPPGTNAS